MTVLYYFIIYVHSFCYVVFHSRMCVENFLLQKNKVKILHQSVVYYDRVNITPSDVRNLLSTIKERSDDEMGNGERDG